MSRPGLRTVSQNCILVAALAGLAIAAACGCSRKTPDTAAAPAVDEPTPEERARQKEQEKDKRLASQWQDAKDFRAKNSGKHGEILARFKTLAKSHAGTRFETEIKAAIEDVKKDFEAAGMKSLEKARLEAETLAAQGEYAGAEDVLIHWDKEGTYLGQKPDTERDKLLDQMVLRSSAHTEFDTRYRVGKALSDQGDYVKAIATLEGYSDRYKFDTERYKQVRTLIDETYAKYKESKAQEQAVENIPWEEQQILDGLSGFRKSVKGEVEVWKEDDGAIEGENVSQGWALLGAGEDNWEEYRVEFEAKVEKEGQQLILGVHNMVRAGTAQYDVHRVDGLEPGKWHKLWLIVETGRVIVYSHEASENIYDERQKLYYGGYAFLLEPEQNVAVRKIRHRISKKVPDEILKGKPAEAEGTEGEKGKKKKPEKEAKSTLPKLFCSPDLRKKAFLD